MLPEYGQCSKRGPMFCQCWARMSFLTGIAVAKTWRWKAYVWNSILIKIQLRKMDRTKEYSLDRTLEEFVMSSQECELHIFTPFLIYFYGSLLFWCSWLMVYHSRLQWYASWQLIIGKYTYKNCSHWNWHIRSCSNYFSWQHHYISEIVCFFRPTWNFGDKEGTMKSDLVINNVFIYLFLFTALHKTHHKDLISSMSKRFLSEEAYLIV